MRFHQSLFLIPAKRSPHHKLTSCLMKVFAYRFKKRRNRSCILVRWACFTVSRHFAQLAFLPLLHYRHHSTSLSQSPSASVTWIFLMNLQLLYPGEVEIHTSKVISLVVERQILLRKFMTNIKLKSVNIYWHEGDIHVVSIDQYCGGNLW